MSSSVRSTFINADVTIFVVVAYCRMISVHTCFWKAILASRWVENLLKVDQILRN